ncbi:MAG: hypothetical protein CK425_03015 [Parachlamydia sp.]|nr:MAG: hypothetical protein CK425_03015 [Parachlamydia sp.]
MKKISITLTFPESLIKHLHLYISQGQISKFVTQMVTNGLGAEKQKLAKEFQEAHQDSERNAEIEIWNALIGDGIDIANP